MQAIPLIATHFSVAWSVCLSSVTLVHRDLGQQVKPFDRFRCHFAGTLVESNDTLYCGVPDCQGHGRFGGWNPQPKLAIAHCRCHAPGEYKRGAIPLSPNYTLDLLLPVTTEWEKFVINFFKACCSPFIVFCNSVLVVTNFVDVKQQSACVDTALITSRGNDH